jgi:hypothetical protein
MSAIGSYVVIRRQALAGCLSLARAVRTETKGIWIFKQSRTVGREEFDAAWREATVRKADFEHSGYVLGSYLDAQREVNGTELVNEESESATVLSGVFTAAFIFDRAVAPPPLPPDPLLAFCREECGEDDAADMVEAIMSADSFYRKGLAEITDDHAIVFLIV